CMSTNEQNLASLHNFKKRLQLERAMREYFWKLNYEEVRTPLLVRSPGMEPHLRPMQIARAVRSAVRPGADAGMQERELASQEPHSQEPAVPEPTPVFLPT